MYYFVQADILFRQGYYYEKVGEEGITHQENIETAMTYYKKVLAEMMDPLHHSVSLNSR